MTPRIPLLRILVVLFAVVVATTTIERGTVDAAPPAPSTPDLVRASDTGKSRSDNVTKENTPTFAGTAQPGSIVRLFANGAFAGSDEAVGGNYRITTSLLPDGGYEMTARAFLGGLGPASEELVILIDTRAPTRPTRPDLIRQSDTGSNKTDNLTSDATPTFNGFAESGSSVVIFRNGERTGVVEASRLGRWGFTSPHIGFGAHRIKARSSDLAGNLSPFSPAVLVRVAPACLGEPATIFGNHLDNVINGTPGNDVIHGMGGNDVIRGRGGNDRICGGPGQDRLFGQHGADILDGGPNPPGRPDRCDGGTGNDRARASCEIKVNIP
ncbi:MAG: hypothetical protein GEU28_07415 [Dehalococcoidia bacterium]|nr:hypothetical protein [Dehalococcoidia bacterium]